MSTQIEDYNVLSVIGSGSFGTCYKVQNIHSKEIFVWKAVGYGSLSEDRKKILCSEVNLLSELSHPNIVNYLTRILHKDTATLYIIMEWCEGGDLANVIKDTKSMGKVIEEWFIWRIIYQLSSALYTLHNDHSIIHRDIKPANIFLDTSGTVKLGDFGLSSICDQIKTNNYHIVGTPIYMSPEILKGYDYNTKSDIWSLGCVIYELCTLNQLFNVTTLEKLIYSTQHFRMDRIPTYYSENLNTIIKLMLNTSQDKRPSIEVIFRHPTVVSNFTKKTIPTSTTEGIRVKKSAFKEISNQFNTMRILDIEPEEISQRMFKEKWLARLESLRIKESKLREREDEIEKKEYNLNKKEKQIAQIERTAKEKVARAEVYLNQCKEARLSKKHEETDASFSADPGDTSIAPTSAKLNPLLLMKPKFPSEEKHVHFDSKLPSNHSSRTTSSDSAQLSYVQVYNQIIHSKDDKKTLINRLSACKVYRSGKENKLPKISRGKNQVLSQRNITAVPSSVTPQYQGIHR